MTINEMKEFMLKQALLDNSGNILDSANNLGITPKSVYNYVYKYGIDLDKYRTKSENVEVTHE